MKKKILIKSDGVNWVLSQIKNELKDVFNNSNLLLINFNLFNFFLSREIIFLSKYDFLKYPSFVFSKIYICIFHIENDQILMNKIIKKLKKNQSKVSIIVSNQGVYNLLCRYNINSKQIILIPISFQKKYFYKIPDAKINKLKIKLKIKKNVKLIGSFQKDGNGWGIGATPKKIKDPDTFIRSVIKLNQKNKIKIILSGPSRGYVINKLSKHEIDFIYFKNIKFKNMNLLYNLIDFYVIPSLEEGGPRSVLESMATGTPVISTNVGQANDIIIDEYNGYLVNKGDDHEIYLRASELIDNVKLYKKISDASFKTSQQLDYDSLKSKWLNLLL